MDDDNGTYVAELRENGKWFLTYDGDVVCLISGEIAEKLDAFREEELKPSEEETAEANYWSNVDNSREPYWAKQRHFSF